MAEYRKDLWSGVFFLVFAVFLYLGSFSIVVTTSDALGPQFFPRIVSLMTGALAVVQIGKAIREKKRQDQSVEGKRKRNGRELGTLAILFLYAVLISHIGFIITTACYLLVQIPLLLSAEELRMRKNQILVVLISVAAPVIIYYLFYHAFSIFLPAGILG